MPEFQSYSRNNHKTQELRTKSATRSPVRSERVPTRPRPARPKLPKRAPPTTRRGSLKIDGVVAVRSQRRFKKNNVLYYLMTAILCVTLLAILSSTVLFNVRNLVITHEGEAVYCDATILAAGGIEQGQNLMRFDSLAAGGDIMTALVQIDSVVVTRVFPATLSIRIVNAERLFSIRSEDAYYEISRNGRVINRSETRPSGVLVTGFVPLGLTVGNDVVCELGDNLSDAQNAELLFSLIALIDRHELTVTRIDFSDRFDIKLYYGCEEESERIEIRLGEPSQLEEKMVVAARIIADEVAVNESGVLRITSPRVASFNPSTPG